MDYWHIGIQLWSTMDSLPLKALYMIPRLNIGEAHINFNFVIGYGINQFHLISLNSPLEGFFKTNRVNKKSWLQNKSIHFIQNTENKRQPTPTMDYITRLQLEINQNKTTNQHNQSNQTLI